METITDQKRTRRGISSRNQKKGAERGGDAREPWPPTVPLALLTAWRSRIYISNKTRSLSKTRPSNRLTPDDLETANSLEGVQKEEGPGTGMRRGQQPGRRPTCVSVIPILRETDPRHPRTWRRDFFRERTCRIRSRLAGCFPRVPHSKTRLEWERGLD